MSILKKIFPSYNDTQLKKLKKTVKEVNNLEEKYQAMSDSELRACTDIFKEKIKNGEELDSLIPDTFALVREASKRVLNMRHFDVQIMGGIVLHQGRIAEMRTGEGKTLVATLPAYLNALTGKGVHVVTVNDYLAKRDAEWMGKVYNFLGLEVGVIISQMENEEKRAEYNKDIVYATNNELGFDYLRDNMVIYKEDKVQRDLNFAIVDEVDNILIDEARTPLIISGPSGKSSQLYKIANNFAKTLSEDDYIFEEKEKTVRLSDSGVEKAEKYFKLDNLADIENQDIAHHINNALRARVSMKKDIDYLVRDGQIIIIDEFTGRLMIGRRYSDGLHQAIEAKENVRIQNESQTLASITFQNYFRIYTKLSGMTGTAKTEENEFQDIYNLDVVELPTNKPINRDDENDQLYTKEESKINAILDDIEDCYKRGQPVLVGTISVEKSEMIAKQLSRRRIPCNVLNAKNHEKEAEIVSQAGKLKTVTVATNMAGRGTDIVLGGNPEHMALARMARDGFSAEILSMVTSFAKIDDPEIIEAKKKYQDLLNDFKKQTEKEREEVLKVGGLRIIGTDRHESRRIDNQLRGRSGRQGDIGSSIFYIASSDEILKLYAGDRFHAIVSRIAGEDQVIDSKMLTKTIERAQAKVEDRNFSIRKNVLSYDDVMNKQRELIYKERNKVLDGNVEIRDEIMSMIDEIAQEAVDFYCDKKIRVDDWDIDAFNKGLEKYFFPEGTNLITADLCRDKTLEEIKDFILEKIKSDYDQKIEEVESEGLDFSDFERYVMLKIVDSKWISHLAGMDSLKEGISLRAYGQKDPVIEFRKEGYDMFDYMINTLKEEIVTILCKSHFSKNIENKEIKGTETRQAQKRNLRAVSASDPENERVVTFIREEKKVGRNEPCPCGSGKKYKNCHGA